MRGRPKALLGAVVTVPPNGVHCDTLAPSCPRPAPVAIVKGRLKVFEVPHYGDKASTVHSSSSTARVGQTFWLQEMKYERWIELVIHEE